MISIKSISLLIIAVLPANQQNSEIDELVIYTPIITQISSLGVYKEHSVFIDNRTMTWWDTTSSVGAQRLTFEKNLDTHLIESLKSSNRVVGIALPILKPNLPANEAMCVADENMVVLSFTSPRFIRKDTIEVGVLLHTLLQRYFSPSPSNDTQHYGFFSLTVYTLAKEGPDWIIVNTRIILQS